MVGLRLDLLAPKRVRDPLDLATGGGVDDRHARVHFAQRLGERVVLGGLIGRRSHAIGEVDAIEPRDDDDGIAEAELHDDVLPHLGGGRGSERDGGRPPNGVADLLHAPIAGAEVVPPLGNAVRLVDGEQAHPRAGEAVRGAAALEAFRRQVEQPDLAALDLRPAGVHLILRQGAVEVGRGNAPAIERVDLVLHERDERGEHDREAALHQRGHLVAERLAAPGRQHDEHVAPFHDLTDGVGLAWAEVAEAEMLGEGGAGGGERRHGRSLSTRHRERAIAILRSTTSYCSGR